MVKALDRKLLRDLTHLRGQVFTVALVVACGIASYVTLQSTWNSLDRSRADYYASYRFGDVFVRLKRAPESARRALEAIPGVAEVHTRLVEAVSLPLAGEPQPPIAEVVSLPADGQPPLGRLVLQSGRWVRPGGRNEAILLTRFAEAHGLTPGDSLAVVLNGELRRLLIVGLGTSPEYVYAMPRGGTAGVDDRRFAVLWMEHNQLATAFQMEGAFNDAVLRLEPLVSVAAVLAEVDHRLDPYGGFPAIGRDRQPSNNILSEELQQLRSWATVVPLIFLAVSVFLVNVVLSRLVSLQRPEIAALKALGYSNVEIGLHYLKLVTLVVLLGAAIGIGAGAWLGQGLTGVYAEIFRFPLFAYRLGLSVPLVGLLLSVGSAALGAGAAVRKVAVLAPAEAMRPPSPAIYRPLLVERLGIPQLISPAGRMVVRELERRPLRTLLSVLGIATALATLVVGQFSGDAFDYLIEQQFARVTRENLSVAFRDPAGTRAIGELASVPGVTRAEGMRVVPVRVEAGARYREIPIYGYPDGAELRRVVSRNDGAVVPLPPDGLLLTRTLGEILGLSPGDSVTLLLLQGARLRRRIVVTGLVDELIGLQGYMRLAGLNRLMGEGPAVSHVNLTVEQGREGEVIARLNLRPRIASITSRAEVVATLRRQSGESMAMVTLVLTIFAATIATGVVYNNARIALSLRSRDFASLRVLGFTRAEISRTLLGELGAQVAVAVPAGLLLGTWLTALVIGTMHPERYRFPLVLSSRTYAFGVLVILLSSTASSLAVRRRLDRLDLIGVLKTRE